MNRSSVAKFVRDKYAATGGPVPLQTIYVLPAPQSALRLHLTRLVAAGTLRREGRGAYLPHPLPAVAKPPTGPQDVALPAFLRRT